MNKHLALFIALGIFILGLIYFRSVFVKTTYQCNACIQDRCAPSLSTQNYTYIGDAQKDAQKNVCAMIEHDAIGACFHKPDQAFQTVCTSKTKWMLPSIPVQ